ncbi:MAG: RNA pseudouridine synthase [Bacteroidetes bacterium HGW-Bacteroidetes-21]|nr:MAG: RNA pseudouridine synthase [Bacteroidetes bacterium HGW-Bacteroidetes-21]
MKYLLTQLPHKTRNNIKTLLKYKKIRVDGKPILQYNYMLKPGQKVEISWDKEPENKKYEKINIVFEDNDIIVINKNEGVLSISTGKETTLTAYNILSSHVKNQKQSNRIFVVHRLDRDTSGLMMFAKNQETQKILQEDWQNNIIERSYVAVVEGIADPPQGTITSWLYESVALIVYSSQNPEKGVKATTHYETMYNTSEFSLLKIILETGRKNQIRVHMKDLGCPVIGDKKYGAKSNPIGRLGLHAWILSFRHPKTREIMHFETPVPSKFRNMMK